MRKPSSNGQLTGFDGSRTAFKKFSMWARVVWAKAVPPQLAHILECGMGLCFIDPSPEWFAHYREWAKKVGAE